ncbi:E3 ubiquitin-protein ligase bre1 [Phytophthora boehmeriae]|uniref:E3 ubiquitin-protein ligase bre1 n=1 Tax=Phytophthora boehmeriae TaxID=109152 RepID=A0A8T1X9W3_9STRA|nr:E3 ubiquitin-protein ligase bre1 [Phytophthora boehmeriae]
MARKHDKRRLSDSRGGSSSSKRQRQSTPDASTTLYAAQDDVLVLGDGDFSFSRGLAKHRGSGRGLLATSFDSESQVRNKYSNAEECINAVRSAHGLVLHDVDATKLLALPRQVKTGTGFHAMPDFFQYIVFNFPHSGQQRVHVNRALLMDFFESARDRLKAHGEVHVTLKTRPPYSNWFIEDQAKAAGFVLKERRKFNIRLFPGYHHRTTDPQAKKFEPDLCVTYVFVVNRTKYPFQNSRAALDAASAEIANTAATEQQQLAAAIVNIAQANTAAIKHQKHENHVKVAPDGVVAKVPAKSKNRKATRRRSGTDTVPNKCHVVDAANKTLDAIRCTLRPSAWKPLHRRSHGIF